MGHIVHWLLTAALLVGVYTETGLFTTLTLGLITLKLALVVVILKRSLPTP